MPPRLAPGAHRVVTTGVKQGHRPNLLELLLAAGLIEEQLPEALSVSSLMLALKRGHDKFLLELLSAANRPPSQRMGFLHSAALGKAIKENMLPEVCKMIQEILPSKTWALAFSAQGLLELQRSGLKLQKHGLNEDLYQGLFEGQFVGNNLVSIVMKSLPTELRDDRERWSRGLTSTINIISSVLSRQTSEIAFTPAVAGGHRTRLRQDEANYESQQFLGEAANLAAPAAEVHQAWSNCDRPEDGAPLTPTGSEHAALPQRGTIDLDAAHAVPERRGGGEAHRL